jgi:tRNA threonylcarbamoyladenosine biosynthesis protein TsaB
VRQKDGWLAVHEPGLYAPEKVPAVPGDDWCGIGSGWASYGEALAGCYGGSIGRVEATAFPHARDIAALAAPLFARGLGKPAHEAAPVYIRNKVALKMSER